MTPIPASALLVTQSDERLLALAQNGHERAFEAIIKRYRTPLRRYIRRLLPEEAAEDALQQASINAWTSLSGGARINDLRPWLYRVAHNASIDVLRTGKYDLEELSESLSALGSTEEDVERRAVIRETLASVAALPDSQREALLRTAIEGDPRADIARDLGVTEGAVRQLVHRARTTLRAAATAITPMPLMAWIASAAPPGVDATARIAEIAAGVGTAGAGGIVIKSAAVVVAAAALTTGTVRIAEHASSGSSRVASASAAEPRSLADPVVTPAGSVFRPIGSPGATGNGSGTSASGEDGPGHGKSGAKGVASPGKGRGQSTGKGGGQSGKGRGPSGTEDGSSSGKGGREDAGGNAPGDRGGRGEDGGSKTGTSGPGGSGGSGEHESSGGKGTSGSGGSSGSGSSGSGSSGSSGDDDSGSSGSGSSGSGSGTSGSGSSGSTETSGSGSSGSGSSGSSGTSGSSGSGKGGSGSGSGESSESGKGGSGSSGSGKSGGSGSGDDGSDD